MSTDIQTLPIEQLRIDCGTQSRVSINESVVADYAESLTEGVHLPPVVAFFDGEKYYLADGFHRLHANLRIGARTIAVEVKAGTLFDAKLHAYSANKDHGLQRTNADKRKAVLGMLTDAPDWSDRAIASHVGVHKSTVSAHRASLAESASDMSGQRTYVTKHGTIAKMDTANIGRRSTADVSIHPPIGTAEDESPNASHKLLDLQNAKEIYSEATSLPAGNWIPERDHWYMTCTNDAAFHVVPALGYPNWFFISKLYSDGPDSDLWSGTQSAIHGVWVNSRLIALGLCDPSTVDWQKFKRPGLQEPYGMPQAVRLGARPTSSRRAASSFEQVDLE